MSSSSQGWLVVGSHAICATVNFFSDLGDLCRVPWGLLQVRDFKKDSEEPGKLERYQAEALVYQHLALQSLLGFVCYNEAVKAVIDAELASRGQEHEVKVYPRWFF